MQLDPDPDPDLLTSPVSLQSSATTGLLSSPLLSSHTDQISPALAPAAAPKTQLCGHEGTSPSSHLPSTSLLFHRLDLASGSNLLRLDLASIWKHITCLIFPAPDFSTASIWPLPPSTSLLQELNLFFSSL